MSAPARSLFAFGVYVLLTGVLITLAPALLLAPLGIAVPSDGWIRMVGVLAMIIGVYDVVGSRAECMPYIRASIPVRLGFAAAVGALVATRFFPAQILLFASVDVAGALWTWIVLRRGREGRVPALRAF